MGRLDNAMRRAAEEQAAKASMTSGDPDVMVEDFPSEEPVPVQMNGHGAQPETPDVEPAIRVTPVELTIPASPAVAPAAPAVAAGAPGSPDSVVSVEGGRTSLLQHLDSKLATKTVIDDTMLPASREQYRRLAAALHQAQRANGFKVVMVASALAGEGKTLTASNLALTLSESYRRNVLLIDGDLRRPSLHIVFQVPGAPGLSDGLMAAEEPKLPLHRLSPRLTVLPAGRATSDPIGALTSERMRRLVDEAREVFDWVIIDTPPIGLLTDASLMSSMADGVVLVVKAESTSYEMVNRAVDLLGRDRLMGVVLNRATEMPHRSSYDYSKYYYSGGQQLPAPRG
jgi:capsular exopolysaccharide synthesis family protein